MKIYTLAQTQEQNLEIRLVSKEEFQNEEGHFPHAKNLIKSMDPVQFCKAEGFRECILGTMKVPQKNKKKHEYIEFGFYMNERCLYLISGNTGLKSIAQKIKDNAMEYTQTERLFLYVLEILMEEDVLYLLKTEEQLEELEELLLTQIPEQFYERLIAYRKELYRFHAYYEQLMDIGDSIQDYMTQSGAADEAGMWQHYTGRAERLHNHTEMLREYLVQIRELYQTRIDMQQNKVMSFLTVVTTIFLPLTLIAGWYGMNFTNMPELGWKYGYLAVIVVSVIVMLCEVVYFRKKKKNWNPE